MRKIETKEDERKLIAKVRENTSKKAIKLEIDLERKPSLTDSKFGGYPYWDMSKEYPIDEDGKPMTLLAQINLTDAVKTGVDLMGKLPDHGILQFFINDHDDCFGMDFDDMTSNKGHREIYHETINEGVSEDDVKKVGMQVFNDETENSPLCGVFAVNVKNDEVSIGSSLGTNEEFKKAADELGFEWPDDTSWFFELSDEVADEFSDSFNNSGHWMFGYSYFTQEDPRTYDENLAGYSEMLLQIDSENIGNEWKIIWGDVGVANFFIRPDDLKRLDFSKVAYSWDCC